MPECEERRPRGAIGPAEPADRKRIWVAPAIVHADLVEAVAAACSGTGGKTARGDLCTVPQS